MSGLLAGGGPIARGGLLRGAKLHLSDAALQHAGALFDQLDATPALTEIDTLLGKTHLHLLNHTARELRVDRCSTGT